MKFCWMRIVEYSITGFDRQHKKDRTKEGSMKQRVLPGQIGIDEIIEENKETTAVKLTVGEKGLIRSYYKYRAEIGEKPLIMDLLLVFRWESETSRFHGAWRDFAFDDNTFSGAYEKVRNAIEIYLKELDSKTRRFY